MKIFTIIKDHSVRVRDKNFAELNGKPLWTNLVDELLGLDITINTDSKRVVEGVEKAYGDQVSIIKRKQEYIDWEANPAITTSPVEAMLLDFCAELEGSQIVCLTHVTSPFLKRDTVLEAARMLAEGSRYKSLHSVEKIQDFCWLGLEGQVTPINFDSSRVQRTQDIEPVLCSKGAFFMARAKDILQQKKRLPEPVGYYPLGRTESIEIDYPEDLEFARLVAGVM